MTNKPGLFKRLGMAITGKGLYDLHPELRTRQHIYSSGGGIGRDFHDYTSVYTSNSWARRCITILADGIAALPVRVVNSDDQELPNHDITKLLSYVNDVSDASDFWRQWLVNMVIDGEIGTEFAMVGNRPAEMWPRRSRDFNVLVPKGGRRYQRVSGYRITDDVGDPYRVEPEQFIHNRFYNPKEIYRGLSVLSAIREVVMIDQFSKAWASAFFKNSARPDYIAIAPQGTTRSERDELRSMLEDGSGGADNAHRVQVYEDGIVDIKALNLAPKDTEWLEQREASRMEIASMLGVPAEVAGFGKNTYENYPTALEALWKITIVPLVRARDSWWTEFMSNAQYIKPGEKIKTDLSDVEVLRSDRGEQINQAVQMMEHGTPANLAYEAVGLDMRIPGGDVGYISAGLVPMGWMPPEPESDKAGEAVKKNIELDGLEFGGVEHVKIWERKQARIEPIADDMRRRLKREFQRQQNELGRALRGQKQLGRRCGFDTEQVKQNFNQMFNLREEKERFRVEFADIIAEALTAAALDEIDALDLGISFDLDRPEVNASFEEILNQFAIKVNDTTYNDLVDLFQNAEEQGFGIPDIMEMLAAYWEGRKSEASTERIARTTMTAANSAGDEAAWKQSGVVVGSRWLTEIDGRQRDEHRDAHMQFRKIGEMFEVWGELLAYPGDPGGSPYNIINCRCTRKGVIRK